MKYQMYITIGQDYQAFNFYNEIDLILIQVDNIEHAYLNKLVKQKLIVNTLLHYIVL